MNIFVKSGLAAAALMLGAGTASALVAGPKASEELGAVSGATPVAMCGYSCRNGGRYVPGPPQVCALQGLQYCGSSRGGGYGEDYGRRGGYGMRGRDDYGGGGCRTVTIERDDGSVRRIRRCNY